MLPSEWQCVTIRYVKWPRVKWQGEDVKHLSGRVHELKRGKWRLTVNLEPEAVLGDAGKPVQDARGKPRLRYPKMSKDVQATGKRDAERQRDKWIAELETHDCTDPNRLTFAAMAERWLAAVKHEIQPVTLDFYQGNLTRHLLPVIGHRIAAEVKPADLSALYAEKRETMAEKSVKHMHTTARAAYSWAMEVELQDRNPAALVNRRRRGKSGQREQREYTTWNPDEIARAVQVARGQLVYLPLMFAGWCGLRRGEVCGLRWEDIDLEAGTLSVCRSMEQAGRVLHVAPPKTAAGLRTIPTPDALVDALTAHHALYAALTVRHGGKWNPEGYVMATGRGTPVKPSNLSSSWADFCTRKALRRLRYHDLRHSYATDLLLRQKVPVNIVAELLGHSDPAITMALYVHTDDRMHKQAGIRQNRRVTAALAKAEQDSRLIRDNVKPLRRAVG